MAQGTQQNVKMTVEEKSKISMKAKEAGFESVSAYMRFTALHSEIKVTAKKGSS